MKAYIYFTVTAIFWGLNFHCARIMLQSTGFIEAGFWRYLLGVIPLGILALKNLPSLPKIKENLKGLLMIGVICLFGFNLFFFLGLMESPAINGALIVSLTPALTLLYSNRILGTKLHTRELIGVLFSFLGVIYLMLKGDFSNIFDLSFSWGDLLLFTSSNFFAVQNVWVKKYGGILSNLNFTLFTNLFCLLSFAMVVPFIGFEKVSTYPTSFWLASLGIGVLGTALAYILWNKGIELKSANQAGVFINVVPLSAAAFSFVFGETLHSYHFISGLIIILGVLTIVTKKPNA